MCLPTSTTVSCEKTSEGSVPTYVTSGISYGLSNTACAYGYSLGSS